MKLTDNKIKNLKPRDKQYKISDGKNLFLLITPSGAKYWRYKYTFNGREKVLVMTEIRLPQPNQLQTGVVW